MFSTFRDSQLPELRRLRDVFKDLIGQRQGKEVGDGTERSILGMLMQDELGTVNPNVVSNPSSDTCEGDA